MRGRVTTPAGIAAVASTSWSAPGDPRGASTEKAERRAARELIGAYHQAQLRQLLEHLRAGFTQLDAGEIDEFELDDLIHHYKRSARRCGASAGRAEASGCRPPGRPPTSASRGKSPTGGTEARRGAIEHPDPGGERRGPRRWLMSADGIMRARSSRPVDRGAPGCAEAAWRRARRRRAPERWREDVRVAPRVSGRRPPRSA